MKNRGHFKPAGKEPRRGKGGKRTGAGRPSKAELDAREAKLNVWEKERVKEEAKLAKRWVQRALKDDAMLRDVRKTAIPDARQEIDIQSHGTVIIKTNVDPFAGRKKN